MYLPNSKAMIVNDGQEKCRSRRNEDVKTDAWLHKTLYKSIVDIKRFVTSMKENMTENQLRWFDQQG